MTGFSAPGPRKGFFCDLLFALCIGVYAFCAYEGNLEITANGAIMDSDLQTYAQDIAGKVEPWHFTNDPVLNSPLAGVSIPNLESLLARVLMPSTDVPGCYAIGLFRAGAWIIFLYYSSWYFFGRVLFKSPCLAAILSLAMGVTVWVGWGTFWGVTHSDPVPRTLFAAVYPFLLLMAIKGARSPAWRFAAMFFCGLCIWIHGISALNCGAMFLCAFLFLRPEGMAISRHFAMICLQAVLFLAPVLAFLWPTLGAVPALGEDGAALIQEALQYRWHRDYFGFASKMLEFLDPLKFPALLLIMGIAAWLFDRKKARNGAAAFCAMCPGFVIGLFCVAAFCWLETTWSLRVGRMPQGHELVRGLRFLVPLSWIALAILLGLVLPKTPMRLALAAIICLLAVFTNDKQYAAAQYYVSSRLHINLPLAAEGARQKAEAERMERLMARIAQVVPPGAAVFGVNNDMPVRYLARRPLVHIFKDGAMYFYSKDGPGLERWLKYERMLRQGSGGLLEAWRLSGAPWLLIKKDAYFPELSSHGVEMAAQDGWLLFHAMPVKRP